MKNLIALFIGLTASFSAFAVTAFYTIDTNQYMSEPELAYQCAKDRSDAAARLAEISKRLSPTRPNVLSVGYFYEQTPIGGVHPVPGTPDNPSISYESKCILVFDSEDPTFDYAVSMPAHFEHLKKTEWNTACLSVYENASSNINSPVTLLSKSWSLFQGRMCSVTTIEVKKIALSQ